MSASAGPGHGQGGDPAGPAGSPPGGAADGRRVELAQRLTAVRARIEAAVRAAGRGPGEVTLVAVTKTCPVDDVRHLIALGVRDIGESRDQEGRAKRAELERVEPDRVEPDRAEPDRAEPDRAPSAGPPAGSSAGSPPGAGTTSAAAASPTAAGGPTGGGHAPALRWHMVGRLQTNKARSVVTWADVVQSVDRPEAVDALARAARRADRRPELLLQVSLDGDPTRGGAPLGEVLVLADAVAAHEHLCLAGLMAVAPLGADPAAAFARLAALSERVREDHPQARVISAGMSADLEAAVRNGATHVRVGTALLGGRQAQVR